MADNGSRGTVLKYFYCRDGVGERTSSQVDSFLKWLGSEGYQIVARRGSKKKPYTGPMTAGETHIGRMSR